MNPSALRVAVVTGGHAYDVPNFHRLFRGLDGIDPYVQSIDDFCASSKEVRQSYEVVLFYIMMLPSPQDDSLPWYAGKQLTALSELGETSQGIVVLHHALLAYPDWPVWRQIAGIYGPLDSYHFGEMVTTNIAKAHPITQGLASWTMVDETYAMPDADETGEILLTCEHPKSLKTLAWTRDYRNSRVFSYQGGHDNQAWADPNFREVVRRGILWTASRI